MEKARKKRLSHVFLFCIAGVHYRFDASETTLWGKMGHSTVVQKCPKMTH